MVGAGACGVLGALSWVASTGGTIREPYAAAAAGRLGSTHTQAALAPQVGVGDEQPRTRAACFEAGTRHEPWDPRRRTLTNYNDLAPRLDASTPANMRREEEDVLQGWCSSVLRKTPLACEPCAHQKWGKGCGRVTSAWRQAGIRVAGIIRQPISLMQNQLSGCSVSATPP